MQPESGDAARHEEDHRPLKRPDTMAPLMGGVPYEHSETDHDEKQRDQLPEAVGVSQRQ